MNKPFIAGITGSSGSGKTYFANCLLKYFSEEEVSFISQDDYYIPARTRTAEENRVYNFDHPEAIDHKQFIADIQLITAGNTVYKTSYTFNNPKIKPEILEIKPAPFILLEGIFLLHFSEISALLDMKIFLEVTETAALERRLMRDTAERGYPKEDILYKWHHQVMPAYQQFLLPHKDLCDVFIVNDSADEKQIIAAAEKIAGKIRKKALLP